MHRIMRLQYYFFIFSTFICFCQTVVIFANPTTENLNFKIVSTTEGLPTNEVQKVFQDNEGFMWFATRNGLCKYDGYQITVYDSYQERSSILSSNDIYCLSDDEKGNLWIGTYNGVSRFNKITGFFESIEIKNMTDKIVSAILVSEDNQIWIGMNDGLFRYDPDENAFVHHSRLGIGNITFTASVKSLLQDRSGEIWIGTWNQGLFRYSPDKNIFYAYPKMNKRNSAHVVYEDSKKNIWIGTWGEGLHLLKDPYDLKHFEWVTFHHNPQDSTSLSDDIVYDICEDTNTNTLCIGTRGGLSIKELNDHPEFVNFSPSNFSNRLPANEVNSIIRDNKNNIWIGSIGGGVLFTNSGKSKFDFMPIVIPEIPTGAIRSVFIDKDKNMWMGVGAYGITFYDNSKKKLVPQHSIPGFSNTEQVTIYDIAQESDRKILFATYGEGLWEYEKGFPLKIHTAENSDFVCDNRIRCIYVDKMNNCWIGTQLGLGIWLNNRQGITFDTLMIEGKPVKPSGLIDITGDVTNKIWIATIDNGIISAEINTKKINDIHFNSYSYENGKIRARTVNALHYDRSGRLWAGTENGRLFLFEPSSDTFVDKTPHFSILGSQISSIEEDRMGTLWISTNNGLVSLTFNELDKLTRYRVFTTDDGLCDNFFIPKSSCENNGILYFGGYKGLVKFYPDDVNVDIYPTPFYITDIKILNRSFYQLDEKTANRISTKTPSFTDRIRIPYKYNNFSIHFTNLNYKNPELNRYAYKLIGFDDDWTYTDSKQNMAYYNNLSPGKYLFQLRATTQNGVWNDKIKELKIVVEPPFWLSWWALILYSLFFILIAYLVYRNVSNRIYLRNQLKYKEFEQEKAEELNHAKLQFFTNITHEFLTPLTIISATVEELQQSSPRKDDLYAIMSRNVTRLTRLLRQILEFRKAESGNLKLRVSYGNISEFVNHSAESFSPLIKNKKIHFSFISDPENIHGLFDPDKLDKILYNLISNAAKYVEKGGAIQVTLTYNDETRQQISLSVKDNGEGISPENQKTLFQRFYEGDYRKHNTTGTGIGLSLVKDIVSIYHGSVHVESEPEFGSNFIVILPIALSCFAPSEIDNKPAEEELQQQTSEMISLNDARIVPTTLVPTTQDDTHPEKHKDITILLVEDNDDLLQLIRNLLNKEYKTFTATNGKEALKILAQEKINLIVSDIMMPEMDGVELCRKVKENIEYSHIPIILLTAKTDVQDRANAYESGADAFISKPFNLNVLQARIKNLIRNRERMAHDFKHKLVFELKELNITDLDEKFLQQAIDCVNRHLDDPAFDQQQFSDEMNVSKSTLYNKLKNLTGLNTSAFITNIRLKAACQIMNQNHNIRISDLAYAVGFNDPKYFSSCFKKEFNLRPSEYIEKFTGKTERVADS